MKLLSLHVENYGHYTDQRFEFVPAGGDVDGDVGGAEPGGFCLVHGENEAGKTTLLQLLRETLFGFHPRTPYDFGYKGDVAAVFRAVLRDGRLLQARRRKGNKERLVGEFESSRDPLDEGTFERLLGAGADLYQNVFGFSLRELTKGEKSLATAGLTEALFGGGMGGLSRFQQLRERIEKEHQDLFTKQGRAKPVNVLLSNIKEARRELQEEAVDPREFAQQRERRVDAEAEVGRLLAETDALAKRRRELERHERCLPVWRSLQVLRQDLEKLELPADFPVEEVPRFERLRELIETRERDVARWEAELSARSAKQAPQDGTAEEAADEARLLELEPGIRELREDLGRIRSMRDDLPHRREKARTILAEVGRRTRALDTRWTVDDLDRFASSTSDRSRLEDLAARRADLDTREAAETRSRRELRERRDQVRGRLAQLEPQPRIDDLEALLDRAEGYRRDAERLATVRKEIAQLERRADAQRARLQQQVGAAFDDPAELPVPLSATIEEFAEQLGERNEHCRRAASLVEELTADRVRQRERVEAFDVPGAPPDDVALDAARTERDVQWREIRPGRVGWEVPAEEVLERYERATVRADDLADERYAHADELAQRELVDREFARVERRLAEAEERAAESERARSTVLAAWREVWRNCGFEPLAPAVMRAWLAEFESWREMLGRRAELQAEAAGLDGPAVDFEQDLHRAFPSANGSTEAALGHAIRERDAGRKVELERQTLRKDLPDIEAALTDVEAACEQLTVDREAWESQRRETLCTLGLDESWPVNVAQKVLGEVMELLRNRGEASDLERRVGEMTAQLEAFVARVDELSGGRSGRHAEDEASPEVRAGTRLEVVAQLLRACDAARDARTKRETSEESRRQTVELIENHREELLRLHDECDALLRAAGTEDEARFAALAETMRRRRQLAERITETERELRTSFGAADIETCEAELDGLDEDELGRQLETVRTEFELREAERLRAAETLGGVKARLAALEGDNRSVEIAARMEEARSKLVEAVDRWAPRVLVSRLVARALERFEREHQPEMLLDVSRLFGRMTRGRYTGLERRVLDNGRLFVKQEDGPPKEPSQLSTGAREQLYLSIRLAYALRYCRTAEPLPLVMDDVLVNFDAERTRATLEVLREVSQQVQVLFLTCHRHVVELVREIVPGHHEVDLGSTTSSDVSQAEECTDEVAAGSRQKRPKSRVRGDRELEAKASLFADDGPNL